MKKPALFGTRFTMQGGFYQDIFSEAGIKIVVPEENEQAYIHKIYLGELVKGIFLPETRDELLSIVENLKEREAIDGLILGGTELPLILRDNLKSGIPFLDTTQIHVKAVITYLLA